MKTLKIILATAFFISFLVSCTPQDGIITDAAIKVQNSNSSAPNVYATGGNDVNKPKTHNGG